MNLYPGAPLRRTQWTCLCCAVRERSRSVRRVGASLFLTVMTLGCTSSTTSTKVSYADGYDGKLSSTAVLGVMRSGSFDMQAWDMLATRGTGLLRSCPAAYGGALKASRPDVFEVLEQTTGNSLMDELLPALVPAARASLILVIEVYGSATVASHPDPGGKVLLAHGGSSSPIVSDVSPRFAEARRPDLEITGILFSVGQLHEVARLEVHYSGPSEDEALAEFATQYQGTFGEPTCGGWNWAAVQGVRATDAAGLPLPNSRLIPATGTAHE